MSKNFNREEFIKSISKRRRIIEISSVALTGIGKFVFVDILDLKLPFIITAISVWIIYIVLRQRKVKGILKYWGFRTDNFKDVIKKVLPFALLAFVVFIIVGYLLETLNISWHIIPILMLYPLWGIIQQFLMISLVAGNMQDIKGKKINSIIIIFTTAILFSSVHYPDYWLILGTFILAVFYTYIYLKQRNVYVLGIFHGWLGALFYYTIVNKDPFLEIFGKFIE